MSFYEVGRETTRAERNLTREGQLPTRVEGPWGAFDQPVPPASVGGYAEITHIIWRCHACKALAVAAEGASPPSKCGKCGV